MQDYYCIAGGYKYQVLTAWVTRNMSKNDDNLLLIKEVSMAKDTTVKKIV